MSRHFSRKRKTNRRIKNRNNKTRNNKTRNRKGGLLFNQNLNVGGIDLSKQTGKKQYNLKTGKWDDMNCYGVGPLKWCKIVPAK